MFFCLQLGLGRRRATSFSLSVAKVISFFFSCKRKVEKRSISQLQRKVTEVVLY